MQTADAHCDTLFNFPEDPFHSPEAAWNIEKFDKSGGVLQYMAICIEPPFHGADAMRMAVNAIGNFHNKRTNKVNLLESPSDFDDRKINILLALEGASPIIDDINNLYAFYKLGIRAITLTWNHRNFVGDGVGVGGGYGLTDFGKLVVREMNKLGMIIDVSHLNEAGFKDVCSVSEKSFAATHSNAYEIHAHPRNLKDYQIKEIIDRKGFIGLNFYSAFLDESRDKDILIKKFLKNVEYFLNLGAEDVLGLGADFDGMDETPFKDASTYPEISDLLKNELKLSNSQIKKIMYKNLVDFTLKMI
ncbi:dipeptidase [Bacteroidota bacterium]